MDKLQRLLNWLSNASTNQIDALYEVIINEEIYHLADVINEEEFRLFIEQVQEDSNERVFCCECGEEISGMIYCDECLEEFKKEESEDNDNKTN